MSKNTKIIIIIVAIFTVMAIVSITALIFVVRMIANRNSDSASTSQLQAVQTAPNPNAGAGKNACELMTSAEASSAAGVAMQEYDTENTKSGSPQKGSFYTSSQCSYRDARYNENDFNPAARGTLQLRFDSVGTLNEKNQVKLAYERSKKSESSASQTKVLADLGEDAFYNLGTQSISVYSNGHRFNIQVLTNDLAQPLVTNQAQRQSQAEALAKVILEKLK